MEGVVGAWKASRVMEGNGGMEGSRGHGRGWVHGRE